MPKTASVRKRALIQPPLHLGRDAVNLFKSGFSVESDDMLERRAFNAYAAPNFWGPKETLSSHIGSVTYRISYEAVGDTLALARVTYWKGTEGGRQVIEQFRDETIITTSNSVANVECEFKGIPLGSAVIGVIQP